MDDDRVDAGVGRLRAAARYQAAAGAGGGRSARRPRPSARPGRVPPGRARRRRRPCGPPARPRRRSAPRPAARPPARHRPSVASGAVLDLRTVISRFCHGHCPVISTASEKLRNVRMKTIAASIATLVRLGAAATVRTNSPATSSSRPSRIVWPAAGGNAGRHHSRAGRAGRR